MIEPSEKDIEAARAAAGGEKIYKATVTVDGEEFYALFKKVPRAEFYRYLDKIGDRSANTAAVVRAQETLILSCALWPSKEDLKTLFAEHYSFATRLADQCFNAAQGEAKATHEGL